MSETGHGAQPDGPAHATGTPAWLLGVRYGIPGAMITAGIVLVFVASGEAKVEGFAGGVGAGLSVLLLNLLYRVGVRGEAERDEEEAARNYYDEHGVWPADPAKPDRVREGEEGR